MRRVATPFPGLPVRRFKSDLVLQITQRIVMRTVLRYFLYLFELDTYKTLVSVLRPDPHTAKTLLSNLLRLSTYREFLLLMFNPERFNIKHDKMSSDEILVAKVANEFDCTPMAVVNFAAEHVGFRYSMSDFYATAELPWQVRQFIRDNAPPGTLNS
jgi:hypothetical protein